MTAYLCTDFSKEGENMAKKELIVRCVFGQGEKQLPELLEESFRVYLCRILAEKAEGTVEWKR